MKRNKLFITVLITFVFLFGACNQSVEPDTTAPGVVTELSALSEEGKITITWKDPEDSDLFGVKICYAEAVESNPVFSAGIIIGKGIQKYEIGCLSDGKDYIFNIAAIDSSRNEGVSVISEKVTYTDIKEQVEVKVENTEDKNIEKKVYKYHCPKCNKEYETVEEAAACCGIKYEDKLLISADTYTIYHLKQTVDNLKNYVVSEVEANKTLKKDSSLKDLQKTYTGFNSNTMLKGTNAVYIYYDRNVIEYTFNAGSQGNFSDNTTVKTVKGVYEAPVVLPGELTSSTNSFRKWSTEDGASIPLVFGEKNLTFNAVWLSIPQGFKLINQGIVTKSCGSNTNPFYYASVETPIVVGEFFMGETEVTYNKWNEVYTWAIANGFSFNNAGSGSGNKPVTMIEYKDAITWCNAASQKEGLTPVYTIDSSSGACNMNLLANGYRLPTEVEWEYAARGGNPTAAEWNCVYSGSNDINEVAWYTGNSGYAAHEVGTKAANTAGLYDMSGNVWEWVWSSPYVVVGRGGGYDDSTDYCTVSIRAAVNTNYKEHFVGFRVARSIVE